MRSGLPLSSAFLLAALTAACNSSETTSGGSGGSGGTGTGGGGEPATLVVKTDKGMVEGYADGSSRLFFGIPYAAPPTGDLRWKPPAPHDAWESTFEATKKGKACPQTSPLTAKLDTSSSEDCLVLNVWAPEKPSSASLPVLVWIHGGAFVLGSGGEKAYDGQVLSETTGMLVVSVNYRLGPLGFLALPELESESASHPSTGGYGFEDQRAALQWVKANIAAFGGDPGKVTLFGESAGGISTCMHMVSPESKGLFQRAIIESGPCDTAVSKPVATAQGDAFAAALGCKGDPDVLGCLRGKSTEEIMSALPSSNDFLFGDGANWFPVVDGWNLPDAPGKLLESGSFEKVPVIVGSNADEATLFFVLGKTKITDEAAFETFAEALVPGHGKDVVAKYPSATYGSVQAAATAAVGDAGFVCATRRMARATSQAGADTFLYHFTYAPKGGLFGDLGAFHSAEIKFVLGNPGQLLPNPLTDEELTMSKAIMGYWSAHADKGNPNLEGAVEWPQYTAAKDQNIVLDLTISTQSSFKKDLCDFWDEVGAKACDSRPSMAGGLSP